MKTITKSYYAALATMRSLRLRLRPEPEAIEVAIAKVSIKPGDVLVLMSEKRLSGEACQMMGKAAQRALPGVEVMILMDDVKVAVIEKARG